ncbi:MAG TPA: hypothetical protein VK701_00235 [Solirubrobacteraceae bacterium]|nr:hypothetical protein [Solirubrobacteraceae bacterium]
MAVDVARDASLAVFSSQKIDSAVSTVALECHTDREVARAGAD